MFAIAAPAVASECAITTHYAMAGNHYGDGIGGAGPRYGSRGVGVAELAGDRAVTGGGARRNGLEEVPDALLEGRALQV